MKFPNDMLQAVATKPRNDSVPEVDRSSCYHATLIQLLESKQLGIELEPKDMDLDGCLFRGEGIPKSFPFSHVSSQAVFYSK